MRTSALHADLYAINMMYADWLAGRHNDIVHYDYFFRSLPFGNGYAVAAGLERLVEHLENLAFKEDELVWLEEMGYSRDFMNELWGLRFTGDVWAVREGEIVFPNEPLVRIRARSIEAYLIEAALLNFLNYQTLVATKASRIMQTLRQTFSDSEAFEFGMRRAQEEAAALWGSRAAYLAGFSATSNVQAGRKFKIPVVGTMAHAFIQRRDSELEAFEAYARAFPDNTVLLIDTYNTLHSGIDHAIQVAKELEQRGHSLKGVRIDSGDLAYLSKEVRRVLDEAGLQDVKIIASNDLDENVIADLALQDAKIDLWGIGTKVITAYDEPALSGVYKVVAKEDSGQISPVIKISDNPRKITIPGVKQVYRIYDEKTGRALADYLCLVDEDPSREAELEVIDPVHSYRREKITGFYAIPLLQPVMRRGRVCAEIHDVHVARDYHCHAVEDFDPRYRRRVNPHRYRVMMSPRLWQLQQRMLSEKSVE